MPTKSELLDTLSENTHGFFNTEFIELVNTTFGVSLRPYIHEVDGHKDPKGLTLKPGASANGLAGFEIASMLAGELGVEYFSAFGRGSNAQRAIVAIRKSLELTQ